MFQMVFVVTDENGSAHKGIVATDQFTLWNRAEAAMASLCKKIPGFSIHYGVASLPASSVIRQHLNDDGKMFVSYIDAQGAKVEGLCDPAAEEFSVEPVKLAATAEEPAEAAQEEKAAEVVE